MANPNQGQQNVDNFGLNFGNPNLNLHPSWSLSNHSETVGRDIHALETTQQKLQEKINELKGIAEAANHRSAAQVNALKYCVQLYGLMANTLIELRERDRESGFRLSSMMIDDHFAVTNMGTVNSLRQLYDFGWRGTVIVPENLNVHVQQEVEEAIGTMQDLVLWRVPFPINEENAINLNANQ